MVSLRQSPASRFLTSHSSPRIPYKRESRNPQRRQCLEWQAESSTEMKVNTLEVVATILKKWWFLLEDDVYPF